MQNDRIGCRSEQECIDIQNGKEYECHLFPVCAAAFLEEIKMVVFHTDLDNTIIYSYKHEIGAVKRSVEMYQGREISFITEYTYQLLQQVREKMLIVPTSTRSIEQYRRIDLGVGAFPYALVCNGGILLADGKRDDSWYRASLALIGRSEEELEKALHFLEKDVRRKFELRFIERLFVFTKCREPKQTVDNLREVLDTELVDVFHNGEKVYVVPRDLNKGKAVQRFREYIHADFVIAAGDSEFDIPMLRDADEGLAPYGFAEEYGVDFAVRQMDGRKVFAESLLEECLLLFKQKLGDAAFQVFSKHF